MLSAVLLAGCASQSVSPATLRPEITPDDPSGQSPTADASRSPDVPLAPSSTPGPAWIATGNMLTPHAFHTSTLLLDGRVLVSGGLINDRLDGQVSAAAELYDPSRGSWSAAGGMLEARWGHTATRLPDGTVLVTGSYVGGGDPLAAAELYDPRSGQWTTTRAMSRGRGGHTATLLSDGRVLVVGGGAEDNLAEGGPRSASAELYDPDTARWTSVGTMTEARKGFTATLLLDGRVLVAGGDAGFASAELFDPDTGRWSATGSMLEGRFGHTATLLTDGSVLVAGGCACSDPGATASAELYDPGTGRWTATGSMSTARIFHTATRLADGTVLVVDDGLVDIRTSAELYDPASGHWTATATPARSRFGYTATLLQDNRVLVVGDYDDNSQASAELFDPGVGR